MTPVTTPTPTPVAERPLMPREYGVPESPEGLVAWADVESRLASALVY